MFLGINAQEHIRLQVLKPCTASPQMPELQHPLKHAVSADEGERARRRPRRLMANLQLSSSIDSSVDLNAFEMTQHAHQGSPQWICADCG